MLAVIGVGGCHLISPTPNPLGWPGLPAGRKRRALYTLCRCLGFNRTQCGPALGFTQATQCLQTLDTLTTGSVSHLCALAPNRDLPNSQLAGEHRKQPVICATLAVVMAWSVDKPGQCAVGCASATGWLIVDKWAKDAPQLALVASVGVSAGGLTWNATCECPNA